MSHTITYSEAKHYVERKLGFFSHLGSYVLVNSGLIMLNLLTSPHYFWAVWPLLGWGIGLLSHAIRIFMHDSIGGWTQRMIARELEKHQSPSA